MAEGHASILHYSRSRLLPYTIFLNFFIDISRMYPYNGGICFSPEEKICKENI